MKNIEAETHFKLQELLRNNIIQTDEKYRDIRKSSSTI